MGATFLEYKMLFWGYNIPRRWCLFLDAKNFLGGYKNFFRDTKNFFWDTFFWDTKTFSGIQNAFRETKCFFQDTKFFVDKNPKTSPKLQKYQNKFHIKKHGFSFFFF